MIGGSEQTQVQLLAAPAQLLGCPRIVGDCLLLVRVRVRVRVHVHEISFTVMFVLLDVVSCSCN